MTVKKLSQLCYLNREIEQDKRRLAALEAALTNSAAKLDELPHISEISNQAKLVADIAAIKDLIEAKKQMCVSEYNRLLRYITSVEDSFMRQILTFRYVNGFSWVQVAVHMGGGNTAASVQMAQKRFLDQE